jgi:pyruvate dehydrogenase E1 component beta subunit
MSINKRKLQYSLAINEALHQMMAADESVFLIGQGVKSPWYVGNTAQGLLETFGDRRVIDTPVSENAITGAAVGAALAGMRPIVVHPRMDFMFYAMDPIINEAANWYYMNGGKASVPMVIWGIINRGGEQAAQHSQALHATFAHVPGLKVVMPSTAQDAKGLMIAAIRDPNPVIFVDDRWLYEAEGEVPEEIYEVPIGKGIIRKTGSDLTLVAASYMAQESLKAAQELAREQIDVEMIDLRTVKPIDWPLLFESVKKTGRLVIADGGWKTCGLAAEISALVSESGFEYLKAPIKRVTLPDCPAPASATLEQAYYPTAKNICQSVREVLQYQPSFAYLVDMHPTPEKGIEFLHENEAEYLAKKT